MAQIPPTSVRLLNAKEEKSDFIACSMAWIRSHVVEIVERRSFEMRV